MGFIDALFNSNSEFSPIRTFPPPINEISHLDLPAVLITSFTKTFLFGFTFSQVWVGDDFMDTLPSGRVIFPKGVFLGYVAEKRQLRQRR